VLRHVTEVQANIILPKHTTENAAKINPFLFRFLLKASAKARANVLVASLSVVVAVKVLDKDQYKSQFK
jgi:hypothetical protein